MLIITGLGRCGTSFLIQFLKEVGFGIGENVAWHEEARAGWELATAWAINRDMYQMLLATGKIDLDVKVETPYWGNTSFRERINQVDKDERQGRVEVIKDPRFTWHPKLIEAWHEVRKDLKLLICHREIEDILRSRQQLPTQYHDPKRLDNLDEFKIDFADFFTMVLSLEIPYQILIFPELLSQHERVVEALASVGLVLNLKETRKIWDELVDYSKVTVR